MEKEKLMKAANEARALSYSPYSNFKVGAAILLKDGTIIQGANIENSSYGLCMCAERNTVYRTLLSGYKTEDMVALALCADCDDLPYPCGACRQVLSELFPMEAPIIVFNLKGGVLETNLKELLPYAFGKDHLI